MKQIGLLPVFYNQDVEAAKAIVKACADGGAKAIEFTNRGDRAIGVFTQLAEYRDAQRPDIMLGAGSICDAPTAAMYIAAGADFVVGPLLDEETARLCNSRKIPYSLATAPCGQKSESILRLFSPMLSAQAFLEGPGSMLIPTGRVLVAVMVL
jgi:2-dehydro-3-deoxyphosphogluconate aldolase/(4S)-4-hydroxy-2-oxoglutarate aldolase